VFLNGLEFSLGLMCGLIVVSGFVVSLIFLADRLPGRRRNRARRLKLPGQFDKRCEESKIVLIRSPNRPQETPEPVVCRTTWIQ
jgi:hypothetical protein